jgi:toxin ParE1/3/4
MKPVVPREQASRDVDDAVEYYLKGGAAHAALGLVDALEDAYALLGRHPGVGTTRYASKVFDLSLPLDRAPEGYRAMDQRRAIKVLLRP